MLISTDEAEARLNNPNNLARRKLTHQETRKTFRDKQPEAPEDGCVIKPLHNGGRRPGDNNISDDLRALIGAEAQIENLDTIADKYGVSHHHAHELANGKVYTAAGTDQSLVSNINAKLNEPHQLAIDKLTETLLALDSNKIKSIGKARDLASVASQLSRIAENTAPLKHDEEEARGSARIIVYSPTIKQENHYASLETTLAPHSENY